MRVLRQTNYTAIVDPVVMKLEGYFVPQRCSTDKNAASLLRKIAIN